jgi:hypothetical protein
MLIQLNRFLYLIIIFSFIGTNYILGQAVNSNFKEKKIKYKPGFTSINGYFTTLVFSQGYGFSLDYDLFKNEIKEPVSYGIRVGFNHKKYDDPAGGLLSSLSEGNLIDYNFLIRRTEQGRLVRLDLFAGYAYVASRYKVLFSTSEEKKYYHTFQLGSDFKFRIIRNSFGIVVKLLSYVQDLKHKSLFLSFGLFLDIGSLAPKK